MRTLIDRETDRDPSDRLTKADLTALYAAPEEPWLRVNFVSTLDGAAQGHDGTSNSINDTPDDRVFALLRTLADVVIVGAGTARIEGYGPLDRPLVLLSRRAEVPEKLQDAEPGQVLMATTADAVALDQARDLLGEEHVLVLGETEVDLVALRAQLVERGWGRLHSEGGPHLFHAMLAAGIVDELCCTYVPRLVAGRHLAITAGDPLDLELDLRVLLEEDGTLLGRWFTRHTD